MRFVKRPDQPPEGFEDRARSEYDRVVAHRGDPTKTKAFSYGVYKRDEVKAALHQLFHGKCAYCETFYAAVHPMDVEHFRPKGAVAEDEAHPGYWWLAMKWDNLLPSCIDCNRMRKQMTPKGDVSQVALLQGDNVGFSAGGLQKSGKKDSFPLADTGARLADAGATARDELAMAISPALNAEHALLLNPCLDHPEQHLVHHFTSRMASQGGQLLPPVAFVLPARLEDGVDDLFRGDHDLSVKGATSIHVYGLNRLDLVQARTELLRKLEFLKATIVKLHGLADRMEGFVNAAPAPGAAETLLTQASGMVRGLADEMLDEIKRLAAPEKPHCSMVQAWLEQFKSELAAA